MVQDVSSYEERSNHNLRNATEHRIGPGDVFPMAVDTQPGGARDDFQTRSLRAAVTTCEHHLDHNLPVASSREGNNACGEGPGAFHFSIMRVPSFSDWTTLAAPEQDTTVDGAKKTSERALQEAAEAASAAKAARAALDAAESRLAKLREQVEEAEREAEKRRAEAAAATEAGLRLLAAAERAVAARIAEDEKQRLEEEVAKRRDDYLDPEPDEGPDAAWRRRHRYALNTWVGGTLPIGAPAPPPAKRQATLPRVAVKPKEAQPLPCARRPLAEAPRKMERPAFPRWEKGDAPLQGLQARQLRCELTRREGGRKVCDFYLQGRPCQRSPCRFSHPRDFAESVWKGVCYRCLVYGHSLADCTDDVCTCCGHTGHTVQKCPYNEAHNSHQSAMADERRTVLGEAGQLTQAFAAPEMMRNWVAST